jgi:hypothetical protein
VESQKIYRAATMIQTNYRRYCARKLYANMICSNYIKRASAPAIRIQSAWRRYSAICLVKQLAFSKLIFKHYNTQAMKIGSWYKGICLKMV